MAHIRQIAKSGRWQARYRDPSGRERARNFKRKPDALRFCAAIETDKMRGTWVDPQRGRIPFGPWAVRWLESRTDLKLKTVAGYDSLLRVHILPRFGEHPLRKVSGIEIREWMVGLKASGLSNARVRQAFMVLRSALQAAVDDAYLLRNPADGVKPPRREFREMLFIDAAEVTRLADAAGKPWDTLVYLLAYTGIRWGEMIALRRSRIDLDRSRIEIAESVSEVAGALHFTETKTFRRRTLVLPQFLTARLRTHMAAHTAPWPDALLFTAPAGGPLRNTNFRRRIWAPALAEAGLPEGLRIHDMRHTCSALLIAAGAHPKAIQMQLGHSSARFTLDRYGHLYPSSLERVARTLEEIHAAGSADAVAGQPDPADYVSSRVA